MRESVAERVDEDTLVLPASWLSKIVPHRDRTSGSVADVKPCEPPEALWRRVQAGWANLSERAWTLATDPELLQAALAWLGSEAPADLADIRVVGLASRLLAYDGGTPYDDAAEALVDLCVSRESLAFATEIALRSLQHNFDGKFDLIPHRVAPRAFAWPRPSTTPFTRLRTLLSIAPGQEYEAAAATVASVDSRAKSATLVTAYLFPTERPWVDAAIAALPKWGHFLGKPEFGLVLASVHELAQLQALSQIVRLGRIFDLESQADGLAMLVDGVGSTIGPVLVEAADQQFEQSHGRMWQAVALLPTDDALDALLDRVEQRAITPLAMQATRRFPQRALRLVTARLVQRPNARFEILLRQVIAHHPAAVDAVMPTLSPPQRAVIAKLDTAAATPPPADSAQLPHVLVSPPWTQPAKAPEKRRKLKLDSLEGRATMTWAPGQREEWARSRVYEHSADWDWDNAWTEAKKAKLQGGWLVGLLLAAPEALATEVAAYWRIDLSWSDDFERYGQAVIARLGVATLPAMRAALERWPAKALPYAMVFDAPEIAPEIAQAWVSKKSVRRQAAAWLMRHVEASAAGLLPVALGKASKRQRAAERALSMLSSQGPGPVLRDVAATHSKSATEALEALLTRDPRDDVPKRVPELPLFWDAASLPPPLLVGRKLALPKETLDHLGLMLAISTLDEPYAGLEDVLATCDPESLARFAWALFEQWELSGMDNKQSWAFSALGLLGDDEVARKLTPKLKKWPQEGGHSRAVAGLDILAAIGSDVAMMHLLGISQLRKPKGLTERARQKLDEVADDRGLSREQLADRLVPDLGLDARGRLSLDYGPRLFEVGFDAELQPFVRQGGKPLRSLPKPGAKDDPVKAPLAYERFRALKVDASFVAKQELARLEHSMLSERRWDEYELRTFFIEHPLMVHLARRLVWGRFEGEVCRETFRVAEDGSLADVQDEPVSLPAGASMGIVHPLSLGDELTRAWSSVFTDYELLQPFEQIEREVFRVEEHERDGTTLERFAERVVPAVSVLSLMASGWTRDDERNGGVVAWVAREIPGLGVAYQGFDPGYEIELGPRDAVDQTLCALEVAPSNGRKGNIAFGALSPITFSELVRDLTLAFG